MQDNYCYNIVHWWKHVQLAIPYNTLDKSITLTHWLTSCSSPSRVLPDQNKCAQTLTARHWSDFLSSLAAPTAHWDLIGLWFSSVKHVIRWSVAKMSVAAASWALLSLISSSYRVNAYRQTLCVTSGDHDSTWLTVADLFLHQHSSQY